MPIPGSSVPCRSTHCGRFVIVGWPTTVPAWKITGFKRSRGYYCQECALRLGWESPSSPPRPIR